MKFEYLPVDLLVGIISSLEAPDIGKLWLCGNSMLNTRLGAGGVRQFALNVELWPRIVWPRILSSLHKLAVFQVANGEYHQDMKVQGVNWCDLPPTLVAIDVSFTNVAYGLLEACHGHAGLFPHLKHLKFQCHQRLECDFALDYGRWFPELEELQAQFERRSEPELRLHLLPRTLTRIKTGCSMALVSREMDNWPPSLVHLELNVKKGSQWIWCLPAQLESLRMEFYDDIEDPISWNMLPENLKELRMRGVKDINAMALNQMPRKLETLIVRDCQLIKTSEDSRLEFIKALPPTLTRLGGSLSIVQPEEALALPRTLTRYNTFDALELPLVPLLPSGLKAIKLKSDDNWSSAIDALPQGLTKVEISSPRSENLEAIARLPHITSLEASYGSSRAILKNLSPTLTHLNCNTDLLETQQDFKFLPRGLRSLRFSQHFTSNVAANSSSLLPSALTYLNLGYLDFGETTGWFRKLPRTLTVLRLKITAKRCAPKSRIFAGLVQLPLRSLLLEFEQPPSDGLQQLFQHVPRRLCYLGLRIFGSLQQVALEDHHFASLPHSLLYLEIPPAPHITRAALSHFFNLRFITTGNDEITLDGRVESDTQTS